MDGKANSDFVNTELDKKVSTESFNQSNTILINTLNNYQSIASNEILLNGKANSAFVNTELDNTSFNGIV